MGDNCAVCRLPYADDIHHGVEDVLHPHEFEPEAPQGEVRDPWPQRLVNRLDTVRQLLLTCEVPSSVVNDARATVAEAIAALSRQQPSENWRLGTVGYGPPGATADVKPAADDLLAEAMKHPGVADYEALLRAAVRPDSEPPNTIRVSPDAGVGSGGQPAADVRANSEWAANYLEGLGCERSPDAIRLLLKRCAELEAVLREVVNDATPFSASTPTAMLITAPVFNHAKGVLAPDAAAQEES